MLPPKCGNWVHLPFKFMYKPESLLYLRHLGFRIHYGCRKHEGEWYHAHPPRGWRQEIKNDEAVITDTKGRERVHIALANQALNTAAKVEVLTYYIPHWRSYRRDGAFIVECYILNPDNHPIACGFMTAPDDKPVTLNVSQLVRRIIESFATLFPHIQDPLAYWD
jgi:hypothetical protein